jgi:NitT/TauT family transport system substrate-binding protein/sulfonate transport system substrate-binding protein
LIVLVALILAACAPAPTPTPLPKPTEPPKAVPTAAPKPTEAPKAAAPKDRLPIVIAHAGAIDQATVFAAVDNGIYEKNGLDAKVKAYATGVEIVNALQAGEVQVGVFGSTPLLTSVANDIPLLLIATNHGDANSKSYNANQNIVASAASGVKEGEIAKLKGKKIGLPVGTGAEPYFYALLQAAKLDKKDVEVINIKPADMATTLTQGSVDAVCIWEAVASTVIAQVPGSVRVIRGNAEGWFDPGTVVTTKKTLAEQRETLRRFLIAHAEAQQWVRQHSDEAAMISTRWINGLDPAIAKAAITAPKYDMRISKLLYDGYKESHIPFLLSQNKISKTFEATKAVDHSLVVEVVKQYPQFFSDLKPIADENQLK